MNEEELRFIYDKLFTYTSLPQFGDGIYKVQLVMTKDIFQECYKKWIMLQECEDKRCSNCKYWLLDKDDEKRKCKYCFEMNEWVAESEDKE